MSPADRIPHLRNLCRTDLYFLIRYGFGRKDLEHPWLFSRCKEVEENPDGYIDLWSREHYKSTVITYGKTIQDILASHGDNPLEEWDGVEITCGIFSHTRPIAKKFLTQIKNELESNRNLKNWFPDILYENPGKDAPRWSLDSGIVVKRKSNPKEATVEAWGVVDGQPTGAHFNLLIYDDLVTRDNVTTPDMIEKTTDALALSYNLGAIKGHRRRFIGTRYHYNDTYRAVIERETAIPRIYPATDNGKLDGKAVFLEQEVYEKKVRDMGSYVAACQLLQNPKEDSAMGFKLEWLRYWGVDPKDATNKYILVDPANEKHKKSDYTAVWVVGIGADENWYVHDIYRDKLSLTQRANLIIRLHKKWKPLQVLYEKYGMQADIEHIEYVQEQKQYRFDITPCAGNLSKNDRIRTLIPLFENRRIYLPQIMHKTDWQGESRDMVKLFIDNEYEPFPVGIHPDMLDSLARINTPELNLEIPEELEDEYEHDAFIVPGNGGY